MKNNFLQSIAVVALTVGMGATGWGQATTTYSWSGGGGDANWMTAGNWTGNAAPTSATTTGITLKGNTNINTVLNTDFSLATLLIQNAGFAVSGTGTLNFTNNNDNNYGIDYNGAGANATIGNNITLSGNGALFKSEAGSGDLVLNGNVSLTSASVFMGLRTSTAASAGQLSATTGRVLVNGAVSGAGGLYINGAGGTTTIALNGANTFTGNTTITQGVVVVGVSDVAGISGAFGNSASTISLGLSGAVSTPTVLLNGAYTVNRNFQYISPGGANTVTATLGGLTAGTSTFGGTVTNGTSATANAGALVVTAAAGGLVQFTNATNVARVGAAANHTDTLTKNGAGIVAFNGAVNSLGATTINAGTLLINGSMAAGGDAVSALSGTTLGGAGMINRAVSLTGATLSAGDMTEAGVSQVGTLTLTGGLTLDAASTMNFDLGSSSDLVAVTGDLTLAGTINLKDAGGFGIGTYTLFTDTGGTLTAAGLTLGTTIAGYNYALGTSGNAVTLTVTPEPGTTALLGLGGTALFLAAGRRFRAARA